MKVRFKNPPINEVVIGAYFEPPLTAFRSEHVGLLWSRLREEFPKVEQRPPITGTSQGQESILTIGDEFMVMPRYWFVSEDEVTLLQVQKDAFLLNWRRRDSEYPHYAEHLRPSFDKYYGLFETFLQNDVDATSPSIGRGELTYINMITPSDYWQSPQDTSSVIRSFSIPDWVLADGAAPAFHCAYLQDVDPNLQLHVVLKTAEIAGQPGSPCLILEIKALGAYSGAAKQDIDAWYDRAHDAIVTRFMNMTHERVQRELWMREEAE